MTFHIITLFPQLFKPYFNESIVKIAQEKKIVKIKLYNLRDFNPQPSRRIDDRPYGGGPGMVIRLEPLVRAINSIKKNIRKKVKIILFASSGRQFDNQKAANFARHYNHLILIAGRYEGVDERIKQIFKAEEISIGPYVLTGGELPAMVLVDAVSRQLKGVLGKASSLEEKRLGIGVPVYTRPEIFSYQGKKYPVPNVLLSGNHREIEKWRRAQRKKLN